MTPEEALKQILNASTFVVFADKPEQFFVRTDYLILSEIKSLMEMWRKMERFMLHLRKHGNRFGQRFAWKALQDAMPKKRNLKRARIAKLKMAAKYQVI